MDVSNPVLDPSRCTVGALGARRRLRVRQDFSLLSAKTVGAERVNLPTPCVAEGVELEEVYNDAARLFTALRETEVPVSKGVDLSDLGCLRKVQAGCPVSGFSIGGVRVHPVGVQTENVAGVSCVSPLRTFGGGQRPAFNTQEFVTHFGVDRCIEEGTKYIYSYGTSAGFKNRVQKQMGMPCKSVCEGYGKRVNFSYLFNKLDVLFDSVDLDLPLDRWEGPLYEMLEKVVVAGDATAGYPYCKEKSFAWDELTKEGSILSVLVEVLKDPDYSKKGGSRARILQDEPEWFLCELKNKLDRYEVEKLSEKCRPYMAMPFHWTVLQSNLCQVFCDALSHVGVEGSKTHSAYKFTAVDDGLGVIHKRMARLKKGEYDYYCYGDDTDFYWRDSNGVLFRCSPDFRQMDGSVDYDCVNLTVSWIYRKFAQKHGESVFWHNVCKEWVQMAVDPTFVCSGPIVYRKQKPNGIMSGVVGTTLFDTVKSVLSYDMFITHVKTGKFPKAALSDEKQVAKFFLDNFGLVVKQGTWCPQPVQEIPDEGRLYSPSKFLGVQWKWGHSYDGAGDRIVTLVPSLRTSDFLALALCPRYDLEAEKRRQFKHRKQKKNSAEHEQRIPTVDQRYIFDWARGLMITCGFSSEVQTSFLNAVANTIGPEAILMNVQAGEGKGAPPDSPLLAEKWGEQDLQYVDSQGFPTWSWCMNLYASKERGCLDAEWHVFYPSLSDWVSALKKQRVLDPLFVVQTTGPMKNLEPVLGMGEQILPAIDGVPPLEDRVLFSEVVMEKPRSSNLKLVEEKFGQARGPKRDLSKSVLVGKKIDPNLPQTLVRIFGEVAERLNQNVPETVQAVMGSVPPPGVDSTGKPLFHTFRRVEWIKEKRVVALPFQYVMDRTGWTEHILREAAIEGKFLVQEHGATKWVTVCPIVTGEPSVLLEQHYRQAEKIVEDNVVPTSKDKQQRLSGAKAVLRKQDTANNVVSKIVPEIKVEWLPVSMPVEVFCDWVKHEVRKKKVKIQTPDILWTTINSTTYSAVAEGESLRDPQDTDEFNHLATHFRIRLFVETADINQQSLVNEYQLLAQFVDYQTGVSQGPLKVGGRAEPVPIATCSGPSKMTCGAALKNFFIRWVWPEYKGDLFVSKDSPKKVTFKKTEGKRLVQTLFSISDCETPDSTWSSQVEAEKRLQSRVPVFVEPGKDAPKTVLNFSDLNQNANPERDDCKMWIQQANEPVVQRTEEVSADLSQILKLITELVEKQDKFEKEVRQWQTGGIDGGRPSCSRSRYQN